jgi:peptidoglycan hydrolase-like protein with peptidoglycan-binding domain
MQIIQGELRQVRDEFPQEYTSPEIFTNETQRSVAPASDKSTSATEEIIRVPGVSARQVQTTLKAAGFYQGSIDGKIGPKTKEGIKSFQADNGLTADGIVGRATWAKLKNYL